MRKNRVVTKKNWIVFARVNLKNPDHSTSWCHSWVIITLNGTMTGGRDRNKKYFILLPKASFTILWLAHVNKMLVPSDII